MSLVNGKLKDGIDHHLFSGHFAVKSHGFSAVEQPHIMQRDAFRLNFGHNSQISRRRLRSALSATGIPAFAHVRIAERRDLA